MRSIINEKNLKNKKILLRLDLNVPLERDKITDTTRIDKILPTLNFLIKKKAKIIILSHVGRPKGKIVKELSLKPICEELQNKLRKKVKLISENIKEIKSKNFFSDFNEDVFVLENIRFYSEEEQNDNKFAELISNLGDIYVNDALEMESKNKLKNILEITQEKLVSIDFNHHSASAIVDASLTKVVGKNMGKISAWYDNEWGFSNRMCDIAKSLHKIS